MADQTIRDLFDDWNAALQSGDVRNVSALYDAEAILLPTMSNRVRHSHAEIEDYFGSFMARGPIGELNESNIRTYGDIAINSGVYTFTFKDDSHLTGRFNFVYRWNGQTWKIIDHHSSQLPE